MLLAKWHFSIIKLVCCEFAIIKIRPRIEQPQDAAINWVPVDRLKDYPDAYQGAPLPFDPCRGMVEDGVVEAHGVSVNDLAEAFGVSRRSISSLLNGRAALSADMAIRFEHAFGVKAETLMRMQARYELGKAREHEADLAVRSLIAA